MLRVTVYFSIFKQGNLPFISDIKNQMLEFELIIFLSNFFFFLPLQNGFLNTSFQTNMESEDESNMEELDMPTNLKDLPVRIDWNAHLPVNIAIPKVDLHSLILDFAAVSFLDISALKGLKTVCFVVDNSSTIYSCSVIYNWIFLFLWKVLKELIRIEVEVYIVACDCKY